MSHVLAPPVAPPSFDQTARPDKPGLSAREWRVIFLTVITAVLSLADLHLTLTYVRSIGMGEDNPLAVWLVNTFSPSALIVFKLATLTLACFIFIRLRKSRTAELGAWLCAGVLVWLTIRWADYASALQSLTPVLHEVSASSQSRWVCAAP